MQDQIRILFKLEFSVLADGAGGEGARREAREAAPRQRGLRG